MPVTLSSKSSRRSKRIDGDASRIEQSLKRFKITAEAESKSRRNAMEDLQFSIGTGQWDAAVKANRELEGKPCLTINRAPAFLRQYTGEERQHRPSMIVSPVGNGADIETARIHQGVLRHIEVASVADVTYDNSYDWMMRTGWCPWRIKTDYVSEMSFDQEPRIEPFDNPFSYYGSPIRRADGTDPLWGHVIVDYSREDYIAEFGDTDLSNLNFPLQQGNSEPGWVTKDGVRVAEYWWMDLTPSRIYQLDDGSVITKDKLDKPVRDEFTGKFRPNGLRDRVVGDRETIIRKVHCVIHDAMRILKKYDYLGRYLPFPEVNGVRLNVNGEIYRAGMIRDYRDAQRIYDFMVTRAVEQVDLSSKDPLWVPEDNAQWDEDYRKMNRTNFSHLYFKAYRDDNATQQLPPPQRAGREAPIAAIQELVKQADYDMKAVVGIYGSTLGEESGNAAESGIAILKRQEQSDTGSVAWHDQLNRAIMWQGKILLDLWPKLIPAARVQRIINPDDSVKHAVIFNSEHSPLQQTPQGPQMPPEAAALINEQMGLKKAYDVGVGVYDLTLSSGPMYKTARKEAFAALTAVITENPEMMPVLGDIWAKNADFPDADVLAARFKKMLPPNLQDDSGDDAQSKLQQAQAQLTALGQQYNQTLAELNRAADTIRTKRLELESRERISLADNQTQLVLQELKSRDAGAMEHLKHSLEAISMRMEALHASMSIDQDAGAAPDTPELPNSVEPHVQPITPSAPAVRPEPVGV